MSVLVRGTVKSLKWMSVFTKAQYSAHYSLTLCLKPCHAKSALGSPGRTAMPPILLSLLNHLKNVSGGSWLGKQRWRRKDKSKCGKDKDQDLGYRPGPPVEFRWVSMRRLSHWSGHDSIFWNGCKHWVHKKCSGLKHLAKAPECRCTWFQGTACLLDGRPHREVQVETDKLEVEASFCYLRDMLSTAGGCELTNTTCMKTAWKKFKELLPILFSHHLFFRTRGRMYSSCTEGNAPCPCEAWPLTKPDLQHLQENDREMIRQSCSETWLLTKPDLQHLQQNDWAMISQSCGVKPQDIVTTRSNEPLAGLGIENLDHILKEERLRCYGHVEHSNDAVKTAFDIQIDGKLVSGRPKMTVKQLTERDCRKWKLSW